MPQDPPDPEGERRADGEGRQADPEEEHRREGALAVEDGEQDELDGDEQDSGDIGPGELSAPRPDDERHAAGFRLIAPIGVRARAV